MFIKDIMSKDVIAVKENYTVANTAKLMNSYNIGSVPVVKNDCVCGILTDRDIVVRCVAANKDAETCSVGEVMTPTTTCVTPTQSLAQATKLMATEQVRRLPVIEAGRLKGIVTLGDIAKLKSTPEVAQALTEISM